jgi:hypothetical protein
VLFEPRGGVERIAAALGLVSRRMAADLWCFEAFAKGHSSDQPGPKRSSGPGSNLNPNYP